ncbi:Lrp/AsnC family transcriptional regulator [Caulobacter segnis]|uniref:Lrp/AsnC family transcriptional regulator n=1 Tax=Caulobacter segnis TaxID=88688 RepID=UPI00240EAC81|nr:Lrp/AsnC family transcriptional regulator [Caulobacter segnis]MDG2523269.1 Lrp/AsnC family transcriptional regulator [Caulobacter segnis]
MSENQLAPRRNAGARDATDERLIALLSRDARMTLTALAQKLALSRTAVQARMARLERDKVILGYRAVLGAVEDEGLKAVLSLTFSQRPCAPVVARFRHWPEITRYYSVTGPVDGIAVVRTATAQDLSALVDRLSAVDGVGAVSSAVVLKSDDA